MTSPAPPTPPARRNRLRRIVPAVLGVAIGAVALSGCVSITKVDFTQEGEIGPIDLAFTGCGSKKTAPICALGATGLESVSTSPGQVLLGIDVDARFVAPDTFRTNPPQNMPFTASPSYTAELTRLEPPDPGRKWVGYISESRLNTPGDSLKAIVPIERTPLPDGSPPTSGFGFSWKIGSRGVSADAPATRDVTCGTSLTTVTPDLTICSDGTGGAGGGPFNDFQFLRPATVTAQPGQTALIPVVGKFTGLASPAITFALAASTSLPGATALTNVPTLAPPGGSTTSVTVSVAVPASAKPGTYPVTLTGTLSTGESRSATGTLVIPAPATGAGAGGGAAGGAGRPRLSGLKVSRKTIFNGRGAVPSVISVTLSDPGRLNVVLERHAPGRKVRSRCVFPTLQLKRAGAKRCVRYVRVSSSTRFGLTAGVAKTSIGGRAGGHRRLPATYRVTFTTTSSSGVDSLPLRTTLVVAAG